MGQIDRDRTLVSNPRRRTSIKKRVSEGTMHESPTDSKRIKNDPDNIQIGETTSLAETEHSTSSASGQVDPVEFGDEGSVEPEFEDSYGYNEGDLEDTGGAIAGGDGTKEPTISDKDRGIALQT